MLSWIQPIHPFVSHKLWKLLIILGVTWDFNCWSCLLFYSLLIWEWAHATSTWKAEDLVGTLQTNVCSWWLRVYLWVWGHSHVMIVFLATSHCGIGSDWTSTCRLCIHWLFNKLGKHACCWNYPMIILSVLLRNCLDLACNIIAIIFSMIGELSCCTGHCSRFKIWHVGCDPSMSTCQSLHWIVNDFSWHGVKVVSNRIHTLSGLHRLSFPHVLLLRIWGLCR